MYNTQNYKELLDEKLLMLPELQNNYIGKQPCSSEKGRIIFSQILIDIKSFFENNKKHLEKPCKDFRLFSHCQPHYLFQFDISSKTCHSYFHEPCKYFMYFLKIRCSFKFYRRNSNIALFKKLSR